ncbi:MAG: E3 ubiquitin-protein ligase bre1 [Lichina confinis]|nr:MAG: E3 ubiquitin-protein ligase bre1 [Lichina confinis]
MDDKKRPAAAGDDAQAPPRKKLVTDASGKSKVDRDADMPWKDDLEMARFQKDAIWRQMQEYKREKNTLEARVSDMAKRATYHDDHLRIVDAWWRQLLDEVKSLASGLDSIDRTTQDGQETPRIPSSLLFSDNETFEEHIRSHSKEIKSTLSTLLAKLPTPASPGVAELQGRVMAVLATEKEHETEIERLRTQRNELEELLEEARTRYSVAEKKLDRVKSQAVAKLEQQGMSSSMHKGASGANKTSSDAATDRPPGSGPDPALSEANANLEIARKEAVAATEKQKEQIDQLQAENVTLNERVTNFTIKLTSLSDDDYAGSELFQHLKSQYEDVIKRVNHLEAVNIQLRQEASALQAERTAYRDKIHDEFQAPVGELELKIARAESDLARIRAARDELGADVAMRKASHERERATYDQMKELLAARDERIGALESETERLRLQLGETTLDGSAEDLVELGVEELIRKYRNLEREYSLINKELPSMGAAWKKASALASKKVADTAALEEKVIRLLAEKSKADQKYFAAMKLNEARESEVKTLRVQNAKSSEIVVQLKDVETSTRQLVSNLEKQLAETREAVTAQTTKNNNLQQQIRQGDIAMGGARNQVAELTNALRQKDVDLATKSKTSRALETETERLKVRLGETQRILESWKSRGGDTDSATSDAIRVSWSSQSFPSLPSSITF